MLLDQVPGPEASDNVIVELTHTGTLPSIAPGKALTVTEVAVATTVLVQPAPG